jgi:hypothetical protein
MKILELTYGRRGRRRHELLRVSIIFKIMGPKHYANIDKLALFTTYDIE